MVRPVVGVVQPGGSVIVEIRAADTGTYTYMYIWVRDKHRVMVQRLGTVL